MNKKELISLIESTVESQLNEMAKITGDLQSAIEKVIEANKDLEMLPLKKAIKADEAVKKALGDSKLHDNQLGKFIAAARGEREVGQRGRKQGSTDSKKRATKPKDKKTTTFKTGDERKYYTNKSTAKKSNNPLSTKGYMDGEEGPSDAELRKLASSGGSAGRVGKDYDTQLAAQEKAKKVKEFLKQMRAMGVVDNANRVLDAARYKEEFAKLPLQEIVSREDVIKGFLNEVSKKGIIDENKKIKDKKLYTETYKKYLDKFPTLNEIKIKKKLVGESTIVDKTTTYDKVNSIAKAERKDPKTIKLGIDQAKKSGNAVTIAEEDDDFDREPTKKEINKTKGLAKAKDELASLTREMKSIVRDYKNAVGAEKGRLLNTLKEKTALKKELEDIVNG